MQYSGDAEKKIVILKITMRKLEVFYSIYPNVTLDGTIYTPTDFFNNGTSHREVNPGQSCFMDAERNPASVSKYFNCPYFM